MFEAILSRSPRPAKWLISEASYWICEWLCGHTARRTSCEINNAGAAIAAVRIFDMRKLVEVAEEDLPELLRGSLPPFTPAEWKSVLAGAHMNQGFIEDELQRHPEWEHLRRAPTT
jgi:hypothetical protein